MSKRFIIAAFGDPGHALPAISLARSLQRRGNEVLVETWERWREEVEGSDLEFRGAEEYSVYPPPAPGSERSGTAARAASALVGLMEEYSPDVVVNDILTLAPSLAAEVAGVERATLIPHVFPEQQPGMPLYSIGLRPPRTPLGRWAWKATMPLVGVGLRQGRDDLNGIRRQLGLPDLDRFHGGTSESLALVATLPHLEYPREWPASVRVVGPMLAGMDHPEVELPPGDDPLVLVAPSTSQDPECRLLRSALEGLADAPVRVLAAINGPPPEEPLPEPPNAKVHQWLSYRQGLAEADLVICHGGHGTVVRSLSEGVPVLVCPAGGDMAENGARVSWAGCGRMLPRRLLSPRNLRVATMGALADRRLADRAAEIAVWTASNDGAEIAAGLLEDLADGRMPSADSSPALQP